MGRSDVYHGLGKRSPGPRTPDSRGVQGLGQEVQRGLGSLRTSRPESRVLKASAGSPHLGPILSPPLSLSLRAGTLTGERRGGGGAVEEARGPGHTEPGHARCAVAAEAASEAAAVAALLRNGAGREPARGRAAAAASVPCVRAAVRQPGRPAGGVPGRRVRGAEAALTRLGALRGVPDGDGERAAEGVNAHDCRVRVAGCQGSERSGCPGGAVQGLGHVRRALQEELLRRQERGTAGAAARRRGRPRALRREEAGGGAIPGYCWALRTGPPPSRPPASAALPEGRGGTAGRRGSTRGQEETASPGPPPPLTHGTPAFPSRPSQYLGKPLGVSRVSGNDLL